MAVVGTLIGEFTALFTGLDVRAITFAEWQRQMGIVARNLQRKCAQSLRNQKTRGSAWLLPNDPKYTARKVAEGYSPKRGTRTGTLQAVMDTAKLTMLTLTPQGANEVAARIVMEEQVLHAMVPHSVYLEAQKVQTQGLLSLAASWVREEALKLTSRMRAAQAKNINASQNVLKKGLALRQANAAKILSRIAQPFPGQSIIRSNIAARQANAANILRRRGR